MAQPFEGVRILDFTRYIAGPYGTYQFALLGADVIKIEPLEGEESRRNGSLEWAKRNQGAGWQAVNANKRSLALDLRQPSAITLVKRLVQDADIVWENFRPGVMDKLGIGYDALRAIKPTLIYAAVSGFGQNGPERTTAAFDGKIQALSGIMSLTGHAATGPTRAGFALSDTIGGMTAAFAVASALFQRTHTGLGQFVDVSMLDASIGFLGQQMCEYTLAGVQHGQLGNLSPSGKVTGDLFKAGDGSLLLAVMTERQFIALMRTLDRADALDDPRFRSWESRKEYSAALREVIEGAMARLDAAAWEARLTAADVPCSTVWSVAEVADHPQLAYRSVLQTVDSVYGPLRLMGPAFRLAHGEGGVRRAPPDLGGDTEAILHEVGYGDEEVATLRAEGAI
jgi:crotonobetainyl-CoA:carnitine CoA-transferase CaiB-like acyl-CoA transferase